MHVRVSGEDATRAEPFIGYLTAAEMVDQALDWIERHIDQQLVREAEFAGVVGAYAILSRLSLKQKLHLHFPEGIEGLGPEYGAQSIWEEVRDLIELRPQLDRIDAEGSLRAWLESRGWYEPGLPIPRAPEPLRSELVLHISLNGLLIYLEGWFDALAESDE